jgi:type IV secretory pathway TraG/TraD family ATPase VirD4
VGISILYQDIPGISEKYPKSWESLKSNIDNTIFLSGGVTDNTTVDYVSKWGGDATVLELDENRGQNGIDKDRKITRKRPLYTKDRIISLDKIKRESVLFTNNGSKNEENNSHSNSKIIYQLDISGSPFYKKMINKNLQLNPDDYVPKRKKNITKKDDDNSSLVSSKKEIKEPDTQLSSLAARLKK